MRWSQFALAAASLLATLAALEVVLRLSGAGRPQEGAPRHELREVEGGQVYCPSGELSRSYFETRTRHPGCAFSPRNNLGTRNLSDLRPAVRPGLRIVGLGDSLVYGFGVDHEDTFLYRLEQALAEKLGSRGVEVINAARPGFDLDDSYALLRDKVLRMPVDLVILGLHLNDFLRFPSRTIGKSYDLALRSRLRLLDTLLYRLELKESGEIHEREMLASYDEAARSRLFDRLRAIQAALDARSIPLLVLIFPLFLDLDDYPFAHIHREIAGFLAGEGIEFIDFLPSFAGGRDEDYWITASDQHPNEEANRIFFERVFGYVAGRGGLAPAD